MTSAPKKVVSAPEPDDSGLLLSLDAMIAAMRQSAVVASAKPKPAVLPVAWSPATVSAAAALAVPMELPARFPARGPGAQIAGEPAFVAAPKDLSALDGPVCPPRRHDPLLLVIWAALQNDWAGHRLHAGESAANGGLLPVPVLLTVLATAPQLQKARKWSQVLTGSGQTNLLAQVANVAGRFAVMRPSGIALVRDFYAKK
jgi:hypothetical protein